jgi:hypothetical protein
MALIRHEDVWALAGAHVMTVRPGSKLEWVIHNYANAIDGAPEVDALPVIHARWIDNKDDHQCSACKEHTIFDAYAWKAIQFEFCPWCGAKMDGERRGSE